MTSTLSRIVSLGRTIALAVCVGLAAALMTLITPHPAHAASTAGGAISRSEVLARARDWFNRRPELVYDSSRASDTLVADVDGAHRYGPDCSGYVSMAWHLVPGSSGGLNTWTLPNVSVAISRSDLKPGDMLDYTDEHAILFEAWESDHVHFSYYSFGATPIEHVTHASFNDGTLAGWPTGDYQAYRYKNIVDDAPAPTRWVSSPADVNGDGKADIVALDSSGRLWLYPSSGQAVNDHVLSGSVRVGTGWGGFGQLYVSDITGDGKADIVALDGKGQLWLYPSTGQTVADHVVGGAVRIGTGWGAFNRLITADVTGDGKADIVTLDNKGQLWLYPSTGQAVTDHVLSGAVRIGTGWGGFGQLYVSDITGDGKADIVALDGKGQLWLYPSTGQAVTDHVLSGSVRIGTGWGGFGQLYVSDITGDHKADIVALDGKGQLWLYPSTGQAVTDHVLSGSVRIGTGWGGFSALLTNDVTGDGTSDVVALDTSGQLWLYPSSGQATADHVLSGKARIGTGWNAFTIV
ncbi:hypothetical protein GCM10029978_073680 [Actinoallomurus acanthiterrae]